MIGIVLALLSALFYGLSAIAVRRRLDESNFFSVVLVVTVFGNIVLWPLALLLANIRTISLEAVLFFAIAGLLAPGIGRLLYFKGMDVVGVSVNASVVAIHPMYSSIFAVLLLSEMLATENWIGIACIVVGVVFVERSLDKPRTGSEKISKKSLVFPLLAALTVALSYVVRKHGLNICNEPLIGVAIGYSLSLSLYLLLLISSYATRGSLFLGKDFRLFWKAGACSVFAWVLDFYASSFTRVSIVTPLTQTTPLFVLIFGQLYLKELEHISFKLIISTLLVVVGAILVSI